MVVVLTESCVVWRRCRTRVAFLERELRSRDALITDLRSNSVNRGGSRQVDNLVNQLKALQVRTAGGGAAGMAARGVRADGWAAGVAEGVFDGLRESGQQCGGNLAGWFLTCGPLVTLCCCAQEENTKLKQAAARQQQLLNQTKKFFEKKISPAATTNGTGDITVGAGAGAGRKPGGNSPGRNGL